MINITNLVDNKILVELNESEMESIQGGYCREGLFTAREGTVSKLEDGNFYECVDKPWYEGGDVWRITNQPIF